MIGLHHIHVQFPCHSNGVRSVLTDLNLQLRAGEFVILLGGNGAGKSTLMNVLSGDLLPSSGTIRLQAQDITHWPTQKRARHIARIFQDPLTGTFGELTLEENLILAENRGKNPGLRLYRKAARQQKYQDLLRLFDMGLENRLSQTVKYLSGGQRQVLSLAMAVIQQASILLLDEHTAALDPKMAKTIMDLTAQCVEQNQLTTLMITHSLSHALAYGDRILMLSQGKIVRELTKAQKQQLSPEDLIYWFHSMA